VRTVTGGAGSSQSLPGVGDELPADPTPEQLLEMLHAAADPAQLMDQLGEAGLLPSEEETVAVVVGVWAPLLRPECDPLTAELAGADFLGMLRRALPEGADLTEMVAAMIGQVEALGQAEAMAMASVLAVLGPGDVRSVASGAAARLAAAGLAAPPWSATLGQPKIGKCFGYVVPSASRRQSGCASATAGIGMPSAC
jgi:hypothetical protein